tara:strand:+ start:95 stop:673 length:579 start_codon:yes stop_codon:yes gene_type:complete
MKNIIITSIKKPKFDNIDNLNFLNNKEECIICSQNIDLEKLEYIIIINNLCKCYNAVKICQDCFFHWISINNQCFICRKSYDINYFNRYKIYHTNNDNLNKKLIKSTKKTQYSTIEIERDLPDNIQYLEDNSIEDNSIFISFRTLKIWSYNNRYKIGRYIFCYGLITFGFITIDKTITYEYMNYNSTDNIIY